MQVLSQSVQYDQISSVSDTPAAQAPRPTEAHARTLKSEAPRGAVSLAQSLFASLPTHRRGER